jgi:hypothetical protein
MAIDLENEQAKALEDKKQAIQNKYMSGHSEEDFSLELKKLMGDSTKNADEIINAADQEKA